MRPQLLAAGVAVCAMGGFFFLLNPLFALPSAPLTLSPSAGPAGTFVNATGSGLPAGSRVFFYWYGETPGNGTYYLVASAVPASDGSLSPVVVITVPQSYLGVHNVTVSSIGLGPTTGAIPVGDVVAGAQFNVTASGTPPSGEEASSASGLSPLDAWGFISVAAGVLLIVIGIFAKERSGPIEPPPGEKFCVFCSNTMPVGASKCPYCNGLQPREAAPPAG